MQASGPSELYDNDLPSFANMFDQQAMPTRDHIPFVIFSILALGEKSFAVGHFSIRF